MHQPIRCKHCGIVVQLQEKSAQVKQALPAGNVPSKVPVAAFTGSAPQAPAAIRGSGAPAAIPLANARRRGRSLSAGFAMVWMVALALLIGGVFAASQFLGKNGEDQVAVNNPDEDILSKDKITKKPVATKTKRHVRPPAYIRINKYFQKEEAPLPPPNPPLPPIPADVFATIARAEQERRNPGNGNNGNNTNPNPRQPVIPAGVPVTLEPADGIPNRRMLAISVNQYLYYNPIRYAGSPAPDPTKSYNFRTVLFDMAKGLKISQVTELSDGTPIEPKPPLKVLIEKAITELASTSRPQDRIILLFSGHVLEVDDVPYLVPYDGAGGDKTSLIPISWVFGELAKSKARQKILMVDLAHNDPTQGFDRPGSGEATTLGEKAAEMLAKPPAGVQVWSACSSGENSFDDPQYSSLFLSQIKLAMETVPAQDPKTSIPVDELAKVVNAKTTELLATLYEDAVQKPQLWGTEITDGAAPYNATEKTPPKVTVAYAVPTDAVAGVAPRAFVEGLLDEVKKLPPVKQGGSTYDINTFPLFLQKNLVGYEPDVAMTPLRTTTTKAIDLLKRHGATFKETFAGNIDAVKKEANTIQNNLAPAVLEFDEMLEEMREVGKELEAEKSKRWHALFHYTMARLLERKAYIFEYNYMLGMIRTDSLPELNAKFNHKQWRLVSREKLSAKGNEGRDAKQHEKEAKGILLQIVEDHKGTPFAVAAARDAQNFLGLDWKSIR